MLKFVLALSRKTLGWPIECKGCLSIISCFVSFQRLKLYYDQGEIKRYNGKRRMNDLKAFVDKFAGTSEVHCAISVLI